MSNTEAIEGAHELAISTSVEHSLAIMREINKITFWEKARS